MTRRALAAVAAVLSVLVASLGAAGPTHADTTTVTARAACSATTRWHCLAEVLPVSGSGGSGGGWTPEASGGPYTAADLQAIYGTSGVLPAGGTPTIAIVDAYNYPSAEADLATYRSQMGLPACTVANGCLSIRNKLLATSPLPPNSPTDAADDWSIEDALDLDAASAICPTCHLMLVEGDNPNDASLLVAAQNAAAAVHYVSMSWGGSDQGSAEDPYFANTSAVFVAATGDAGYESDAIAPSTLAHVVGVGGVSLATPTSTPTVWNNLDGAAGSSCSTRVATPSLQAPLETGCDFKASSDISGVADPETGIAAYDTYGTYGTGGGGWYQMGGTSAAAPMMTALYALVGNHTEPEAPYQEQTLHPNLLEDVTSGNNGACGTVLCDAGTGWDGPTGIGMPLSPEAVGRPLGHLSVSAGRLHGTRLRALTKVIALPTTVPDTAGVRQRLASSTAHVSNLPRGLRARVVRGTLRITGTPTRAGSGTAHITLTGRTPAGRTASGVATLRWVISRHR